MTMSVEVYVEGLSICYPKNGMWNVYFVCDASHPCNLSINKLSSTPLHFIHGGDLEIKFSSQGLVFELPTKGKDYDRILNMAAPWFHGTKLVEARQKKIDVIAMSFPQAIVSVPELSPRDYYIQDASKPGDPPIVIPPVAKKILATFEVNADLSMSIATQNGAVVRPPDIFPYKDNGLVRLEFDNNCGDICIGNDSLDLYELVRDTDGKMFYTGQVKGLNGVDREAFFKATELESFIFNSRTGDCDPVNIDPPPGP